MQMKLTEIAHALHIEMQGLTETTITQVVFDSRQAQPGRSEEHTSELQSLV